MGNRSRSWGEWDLGQGPTNKAELIQASFVSQTLVGRWCWVLVQRDHRVMASSLVEHGQVRETDK